MAANPLLHLFIGWSGSGDESHTRCAADEFLRPAALSAANPSEDERDHLAVRALHEVPLPWRTRHRVAAGFIASGASLARRVKPAFECSSALPSKLNQARVGI